VIAGPTITRSLAELGASVMRVTSPHFRCLPQIKATKGLKLRPVTSLNTRHIEETSTVIAMSSTQVEVETAPVVQPIIAAKSEKDRKYTLSARKK